MDIGKSTIDIHCNLPAVKDSEFIRWRRIAEMGRQPILVFSPPPPKNNTRMKKFEPRDGKKCASWKPWWFDHESLCHLDIGISATVILSLPLIGYLKLKERPKREPSIYQAHSNLPSFPSCTILQKCWKILLLAQCEYTVRLNEILFAKIKGFTKKIEHILPLIVNSP